MIDVSIKYYSIPHRFRFTKHMGAAVMQYSIYFTNQTLLPLLPSTLSGECCNVYCFELTQFLCYFVSLLEFKPRINFEYFDLVGGRKAFNIECGTGGAAVAQAVKVSFKIIFYVNILNVTRCFIIFVLYYIFRLPPLEGIWPTSWLPWLSKLQMNQLKHFKVTLIPGVK